MRKEERLMYAMEEIEDSYIEQAELPEVGKRKSEWVKWLGVAASAAIIIFVYTQMPKDIVVNPATETENYESETGAGELDRDWAEGLDGEMLLVISPLFDSGTMGSSHVSANSLEEMNKNLPWNKSMVFKTLPVYENLAYYSPAGEPVYMSSEELLKMAEDIAEKLDAEIISTAYTWTSEAEVKPSVYQISVVTDFGEIKVDGDGRVFLTFTDGGKLPDDYIVSSESSVEEANRTVTYLLKQFSNLIETENLIPDSYVEYDLLGNRDVTYRAVGTSSEVDNILEYYFNDVYFYCDEERGLWGLRYGDRRTSAECLGNYPIITVEEAEALLKEGKYIANMVEAEPFYDDAIQGVELMYIVGSAHEYFQPYYCFYVKQKDVSLGYERYYVPAVKGAYLKNWY